ncbi:hypothetical protein B0T16DRAFT_406434 [Cercophora newfieldiana]|uniref:CENP-V/GFA domain-containing protein n=1 Tax=Cercophora newfieldiana TaxID=92897 RepID=A0AA40CX95_9PEZI|nr:hypothetical protein B0T16DRAFT_406434 [Cercophora newfieldiana]
MLASRTSHGSVCGWPCLPRQQPPVTQLLTRPIPASPRIPGVDVAQSHICRRKADSTTYPAAGDTRYKSKTSRLAPFANPHPSQSEPELPQRSMAFLPPTPLTLTGGCMCAAVRYTIKVPALEARPLIPDALLTPLNEKGETVPTCLPHIVLDHCRDCRRACGGIIQCWFVCQLPWVNFTLMARGSDSVKSYNCEEIARPAAATLQHTYLGHYESSANVQRCFCTQCGTTLTYHYSGDRNDWTLGPIVDIGVGTLDDEGIELARPERPMWWEYGTEWVKAIVEGGEMEWLIRHPMWRPSEIVGSKRGSGA